MLSGIHLRQLLIDELVKYLNNFLQETFQIRIACSKTSLKFLNHPIVEFEFCVHLDH